MPSLYLFVYFKLKQLKDFLKILPFHYCGVLTSQSEYVSMLSFKALLSLYIIGFASCQMACKCYHFIGSLTPFTLNLYILK